LAAIGDGKDQHCLDRQRDGDPQDRQGIGQDDIAFEAEEQHQRGQQGDDGNRGEDMQELFLRTTPGPWSL
jgi:hypothetical protein